MRTLWRVFPLDAAAAPGTRFSSSHLPDQSGEGRFDLPASTGASSWYFAESPEHALAEKLQHLRNRVLHDEFLFERGRRLAICPVEIDAELGLADLCDPRYLLERGVAPDRLASSDRSLTQDIAQRLHGDVNLAGFRWWSALSGDWHATILFNDRIPPGGLEFFASTYLYLDSEAVAAAAAALGIEVARS